MRMNEDSGPCPTIVAPGGMPPWGGTAAQSDVNLLDMLTQLARRKRLVAKGTGIAFAAGVILSLALPVRYTATTKIMPPQQTPSTASLLMSQLTTGGAGSLAALAGGGLGLKNPNEIYIGLLESRPVADALIQQFALAKVYHSRDMTAARKKLAGYTEVTSEKEGFITVAVTDTDKKRSAAMANAYTDQLRVLTGALAMTEASQRRLFYQEQLTQARDALVRAEMDFQQVQQSKGLVQLDAQAKAMIADLAALRAQAAAKRVQVQALRSYATEQNPELELQEQQLSTIQAEVATLEQSHAPGAPAGLGLQDVPGAGMDYLRAQHEVLYRQALLDLLMKQYDAARLDEARSAVVIQVVEPAIEPDRRSSPKRAAIVLLFTALGLAASCFLALAQWRKEVIEAEPEFSSRLQELKSALSMKRRVNPAAV